LSAVLLLVGLLVLSYLGSLLVDRRSASGAGLPSGVEYAALGFVLGPHALALVAADSVKDFEPIVQVALGWLSFTRGLDFGIAGDRRVRGGSLALATLGALVTAAAVACAAWFVLGHVRAGLTGTDRLLLAGGLGAACSETTRHAVAWVVERHGAHGPLADRMNEIAHADAAVPLLALAVLFAFEPAGGIAIATPMPLRDWPALTIVLGSAIGAGAALLLRGEMQLEDTWAALFGVSLIAVGMSTRLALSTLTACFFMGIVTSAMSHHRKELREMVIPTERPVLLPALLLAGARLDFRAIPQLAWLAAAAIGARMIAKVIFGWMLAVASPSARKAGPLVGLSLMSSGALSISIGLAYALRFPGPVGDTVLAIAALSATVGEFVGPPRLRHALEGAGEIAQTRTATEVAA
jgi:Kef-type K+ transport system membrane component KefB